MTGLIHVAAMPTASVITVASCPECKDTSLRWFPRCDAEACEHLSGEAYTIGYLHVAMYTAERYLLVLE